MHGGGGVREKSGPSCFFSMPVNYRLHCRPPCATGRNSSHAFWGHLTDLPGRTGTIFILSSFGFLLSSP